jgi:hypothetical protein
VTNPLAGARLHRVLFGTFYCLNLTARLASAYRVADTKKFFERQTTWRRPGGSGLHRDRRAGNGNTRRGNADTARDILFPSDVADSKSAP